MLPTHFLYLLLPPREDFLLTMTEDEAAIMGRHSSYLRALCDAGKLLMAGPTLNGAYGVAIFAVADRAEMEAIAAADPAVTSGLATVRLHPWFAGIQSPILQPVS